MKGPRRSKHVQLAPSHHEGTDEALFRYRRDVREATKFIETALVIDKAMFDKRNGSTRAEVVHDAIQVANIADLVSIFPLKISKDVNLFELYSRFM